MLEIVASRDAGRRGAGVGSKGGGGELFVKRQLERMEIAINATSEKDPVQVPNYSVSGSPEKQLGKKVGKDWLSVTSGGLNGDGVGGKDVNKSPSDSRKSIVHHRGTMNKRGKSLHIIKQQSQGNGGGSPKMEVGGEGITLPTLGVASAAVTSMTVGGAGGGGGGGGGGSVVSNKKWRNSRPQRQSD